MNFQKLRIAINSFGGLPACLAIGIAATALPEVYSQETQAQTSQAQTSLSNARASQAPVRHAAVVPLPVAPIQLPPPEHVDSLIRGGTEQVSPTLKSLPAPRQVISSQPVSLSAPSERPQSFRGHTLVGRPAQNSLRSLPPIGTAIESKEQSAEARAQSAIRALPTPPEVALEQESRPQSRVVSMQMPGRHDGSFVTSLNPPTQSSVPVPSSDLQGWQGPSPTADRPHLVDLPASPPQRSPHSLERSIPTDPPPLTIERNVWENQAANGASSNLQGDYFAVPPAAPAVSEANNIPLPTDGQESVDAFDSQSWPAQEYAAPEYTAQEYAGQEYAGQEFAEQEFHAQPLDSTPAPVAVSDPTDETCHIPNTSLPRVAPIYPVKANTQGDGFRLLDPYQQRADCVGKSAATSLSATTGLETIPTQFTPWWADPVRSELGFSDYYVPLQLSDLLHSAVGCSPHVQVAATEPHILQTQVFVEAAEFDWRTFIDTKYDDINDPVGNTLTTGNNDDRFTQGEWYGQGGVRRRNRAGGEFEISQRLGYLNNNSIFLVPPYQGSSRLQLSYRQPLMRGRGTTYNESLILLAKIDYTTAADEFIETLQTHLLSVTDTYWDLVRARADYLQKQRLLNSAEQILEQLRARADVDASSRQILRAEAAVQTRRAEIARSLTSIRNAESQLRLLVNAPDLVSAAGAEFTPVDVPMTEFVPVELADALSTALTHRQDISKAIRELRSSNVKLGVAKNELLPRLDMVLGSYVAGLDGNSDVFNSWVNQFRDGRPGFNIAFEFEMPSGNRAARAREMRRRWELNKSLHEFRSVVETAFTEVEVATREVETTHKELLGRYQAMIAAKKETEYLRDRWETLPGLDDSVTLLLEDLLDSQQRLAGEESAFAKAQSKYALSFVELQKAMGTLFQVD